MKGRVFWEKRTLKKFSIIFESAEIIVGANKKNKYQTFRKDTGAIAFSKREVLEMRFHDLAKKAHLESDSEENKQLKHFDNSALGFNFS